jgi:hypothetical protein
VQIEHIRDRDVDRLIVEKIRRHAPSS